MSAQQIKFRASIPQVMSAIRTGGDGMRLMLDVPESDVMEATALIALRNCALKITIEVDNQPFATKEKKAKAVKEPKEPKRKGPFGDYWQAMFASGFQHNFDLLGVLPRDASQSVKDAIKALFMVDSMTDIAPAEFDQWCDRNHLQSMITLSRQAAAKVQI